jgi:hypothetical protein
MKHLYSFDQKTRESVVDLRQLSEFIILRRKEFAPLLKYYKNGSVDVDRLSKDIEDIIERSHINESLSDVVKLGGLVLKALGIFATLPYWAYKAFMNMEIDGFSLDGSLAKAQRKERDFYLILNTFISICYILAYSYLGVIIYKNHIDPDTGIVKEKKLAKEITCFYKYRDPKSLEHKAEITIPEHYILKVNVDGKYQTWHIFDMERADTIRVGSKLVADGDITQVGPWYEWGVGKSGSVAFYPKENSKDNDKLPKTIYDLHYK